MEEEKQEKYVFSSLVQGKDDIRGHVAYAIYKLRKIDYIVNVNGGNRLTEEQKEDFRKRNTTDASIKDYIDQATDALEKYANIQFKRKGEEIEKDVKKKQRENFKQYLKDVLHPTWANILLGILESVVGAIIIGFVVMNLAISGGFSIGNVRITYVPDPEQEQAEKQSSSESESDKTTNMESMPAKDITTKQAE